MKNLIYLPILIFISLVCFNDCPKKGDSPKAKLEHLDSLKNRDYTSPNITMLSMDSIMKPGDDTKRFSENQYVHVSGYVYDVKWGGSETCNCHTKDKSQLDIHIEIVNDLKDASGTKRMIVEVNRYTRASYAATGDSAMTMGSLKLLKGKRVDLYGWMFFDDEHKQNAANTMPNGTNLWRATCWELHPLMSIKEIK